MTLATYALTTLEAARLELGLTDSDNDIQLERIINAASKAIERYCGREFSFARARVEDVPGTGGFFLFLSRTPVLEVASVAFDGGTIDEDSYEIHSADGGILRANGGWAWTAGTSGLVTVEPLVGTERNLYRVTYSGGYVTEGQIDATDETGLAVARTLPYDLEQACLLLTTDRYRRQGRDPSIASESLLSHSVSYRADDYLRATTGGLPAEVAAMLQPYRRVRMA